MSTEEPKFDVETHSSTRPDWRRAIRDLRELVRDPDRTELAFSIQQALDPDMHERALRGMLAHREGRRIFAERPSLLDSLTNRDALLNMADGSLGRAYLDHIDQNGLDPAKLVSLGLDYETAAERFDPDIQWMAERGRLTHDLWHVLTGYGADEVGETSLLLFSHGQAGGRSNALLSLGASLKMIRWNGVRWIREAWQAWRRGRSAVSLGRLPYERLLHLPLNEIRAAARIDPPRAAETNPAASDSVSSGSSIAK